MPYSMMLDSGHGGSDPGAVYRGRREKDDTLRLTLAVGEILQENGIEVLYTRTTDVYLSPYERAVEANQAGVDHLYFHSPQFFSKRQRGVRCGIAGVRSVGTEVPDRGGDQ